MELLNPTEISSPPNTVTNTHVTELLPEILSLIFCRSIAPKFLLDASLTACFDSPWHKAVETALSISTVCRAWHLAGIPFIYENVVFRHLGQIPAFFRTIETAPSKYQTLVKEITVYTCVPPHYGASFSRYIQKIISNCPSLTSLSFLSLVEFPSTVTLPAPNPGITHLGLNDIVMPTILCLIDSTRDSLISLSIILNNDKAPGTDIIKPILLPHLCDLSIEVGSEQKYLDSILQLLIIPRLQKFVYAFPGISKKGCECRNQNCQQMVSFLKTYGSQLRVLHLQSTFEWRNENVQELLNACPLLEHLVLSPGIFISVSHPTIKWMDIRSSSLKSEDSQAWTMSSAQAAFPKLQGFRKMFVPDEILRTIPTIIPPDSTLPNDTIFEISFPGIKLQSTPGAVHVRRFIDDLNWQDLYLEDTPADSNSHSAPDDVSWSSGEDIETNDSVSVGSLDDLRHSCDDDSFE